MANNLIRYSDILGDTIKTNFGHNQIASAVYNLWASTKEGKRFYKKYEEGGRYGHVSILFQSRKFEASTAVGETQVYYNQKGEKPQKVERGKFSSKIQAAARKGTPDSYISMIVSVGDPKYSPDNFTDFGTQLAELADTYEHESQHVEQHMESLISTGIRLKQREHHDNMRPYGPLYQERRDVWLELQPFWEKTYNKRKEQYGWSIEKFIFDSTNGFADE